MRSPATSCPERRDWQRLTAHRRDPQGREPAGWKDALEHLDRCDRCRGEALAVDPTLLFRRLPAPPVIDADTEAAAMRRAVTALRRAERVEGRFARPASIATWGRWAAAAAVGLLVLSLGGSSWLAPAASGPQGVPGVTRAGVGAADGPREMADVFDPAAEKAIPSMPLYEVLDTPDSRIYQIAEGPEFTMVMIVSDRYENLGG
jgi:hypothetical protein